MWFIFNRRKTRLRHLNGTVVLVVAMYMYTCNKYNERATYLGNTFRIGMDTSPTSPGMCFQQTDQCVPVCSHQVWFGADGLCFQGGPLKFPNTYSPRATDFKLSHSSVLLG
jgi:hypothetical protein